MEEQQGLMPLILEGYSQVILQMANKLLNGKQVSKVTENWKMNYSLEVLQNLLRQHSEVQIHHVWREENKLVDLVANYGEKQRQELKQQLWEDQMEEDLTRRCLRILE